MATKKQKGFAEMEAETNLNTSDNAQTNVVSNTNSDAASVATLSSEPTSQIEHAKSRLHILFVKHGLRVKDINVFYQEIIDEVLKPTTEAMRANESESTIHPTIHLSATDGDSIRKATQFVFHKIGEQLMIELYPKDGATFHRWQADLDVTAKHKLIKFLNHPSTL